MAIDSKTAVLLSTYATRTMAQLITSALQTEGIEAALVQNGREGPFPVLELVSDSGCGLFVAPRDEFRARAIAGEIERY